MLECFGEDEFALQAKHAGSGMYNKVMLIIQSQSESSSRIQISSIIITVDTNYIHISVGIQGCE